MNNYNPYYSNPFYTNTKKSLPAWLWILSVVSIVACILYAYFVANFYVSILEAQAIEDTNGENNYSLNTLDFADFFYIDKSGEPLDISSALTRSNSYINKGLSSTFNHKFTFLNGYSFVFEDIDYSGNMTIEFSSSITKGNFEARIYMLPFSYKTDLGDYSQEMGAYKVPSKNLILCHTISANSDVTKKVDVLKYYSILIVVAGESANGNFTYKITK